MRNLLVRTSITALLCLFIAGLLPVHADTPQSALIVSPYSESVSLNKGSSVTFTFNMNNTQNIPIRVTTRFMDFRAPLDKSGTPEYFVSTENDNGAVFPHSWFSSVNPVVIQPHSYIKFDIAMQVPQNATPGGHYGGIQFEPSPVTPTGTPSGIFLTGRIGIPVVITVNGALNHNLAIASFGIRPSVLNVYSFFDGSVRCFFASSCPLNAIVEFANSGNVHESPSGVIELYDMTGTKVYSAAFNENKALVLPQSSRIFTVPIDPDKIGGLKLGTFTAKLVVAYGDNTNISGNASFLMFDYTYIIALVLLILIVGAAYVFRKYNKKNIANRPV